MGYTWQKNDRIDPIVVINSWKIGRNLEFPILEYFLDVVKVSISNGNTRIKFEDKKIKTKLGVKNKLKMSSTAKKS